MSFQDELKRDYLANQNQTHKPNFEEAAELLIKDCKQALRTAIVGNHREKIKKSGFGKKVCTVSREVSVSAKGNDGWKASKNYVSMHSYEGEVFACVLYDTADYKNFLNIITRKCKSDGIDVKSRTKQGNTYLLDFSVALI